ncbi:hypothetical protein F8388_025990 [Cannabis sativa]|uniref:Uncharacterized protein n=1 Tax=Cannabis sativa TaxID=3483 RepID=A0A7J6E5G7_CANSA|nr:hypothetical protein F8388_024264 [Cannabis sativa]KAF4355987.1 hypothetical protein F8388_025990 [Cannabis sativa]KAF4387653.1 hypothetical protein G4B88_003980 [Cannabis sativa]
MGEHSNNNNNSEIRKRIYLTIMSSVDFEETGHKLLNMKIHRSQQELSEQLGIRILNERLSNPRMYDSFESIFPKDNEKDTRFAINFFNSIGLGGLTDNMREYLKKNESECTRKRKHNENEE